MSVAGITLNRTISALRHRVSAAIVSSLFLGATAFRLITNLEVFDGVDISFAAVWALSIVPFLPVLVTFLSMDVWSEERRTGSIDLLLCAPVLEYELVLGKALGVFVSVLLIIITSLVSALVGAFFFLPSLFAEFHLIEFLPSLVIITLQSALWTVLATLISAFLKRFAAGAALMLVVAVALPNLLFVDNPFSAHALDFASGCVSSGVTISYLVFIVASLIATTFVVRAYRFRGASGRWRSIGCRLTAFLYLILAASLSFTAFHFDQTLDLPLDISSDFDEATRRIFYEGEGTVEVELFISRSSPQYPVLSRLFRRFKALSHQCGSLRLQVDFIDPRWDTGPATRLVHEGVSENSVVFSRASRREVLSVENAADEHLIAAALRRMCTTPKRRDVYWTHGHGEFDFNDYGPWGMSDIARSLHREGYRNLKLELSSAKPIPSGCAFIVIASAKSDLSRAELSQLMAYVDNGGRLLILNSPSGRTVVEPLLANWGLRSRLCPLDGVPTVSGGDVASSEFSDHPICRALAGSRVIFSRPLAFEPTSALSSNSVDRTSFKSLAKVGDSSVAMIIEKGAHVGGDIAVRPSRIAVIGDGALVANSQLTRRANANRALILNCAAYLAGAEVFDYAEAALYSDGDNCRLKSGLDSLSRAKLIRLNALSIPGALFLILLIFALRRKGG